MEPTDSLVPDCYRPFALKYVYFDGRLTVSSGCRYFCLFVGIVVFDSMSFVITPPMVSILQRQWLTSEGASLTSPVSSPGLQRDCNHLVRINALRRRPYQEFSTSCWIAECVDRQQELHQYQEAFNPESASAFLQRFNTCLDKGQAARTATVSVLPQGVLEFVKPALYTAG
jgi:hypothetical protein